MRPRFGEKPRWGIDTWGPLYGLVQKCLKAGLRIVEVADWDGNVHFPDFREAVFGRRAATYVPFEKVMYLNWTGLARYGPYMAHVHELGHVVWNLLLTPQQRWIEYVKLHGYGKVLGRLIPYNRSAPSIEESFAQDFEAFWTDDSLQDQAGMGRGEFARLAPTRFAWLRDTLKRLEV